MAHPGAQRSVRKPSAVNSWYRLGPGEGPETPDFSIEALEIIFHIYCIILRYFKQDYVILMLYYIILMLYCI